MLNLSKCPIQNQDSPISLEFSYQLFTLFCIHAKDPYSSTEINVYLGNILWKFFLFKSLSYLRILFWMVKLRIFLNFWNHKISLCTMSSSITPFIEILFKSRTIRGFLINCFEIPMHQPSLNNSAKYRQKKLYTSKHCAEIDTLWPVTWNMHTWSTKWMKHASQISKSEKKKYTIVLKHAHIVFPIKILENLEFNPR